MRIVKGKEELDDDLRERGVVSGTTFVNAERPRQQALSSLLGIICKCGRMNSITVGLGGQHVTFRMFERLDG